MSIQAIQIDESRVDIGCLNFCSVEFERGYGMSVAMAMARPHQNAKGQCCKDVKG